MAVIGDLIEVLAPQHHHLVAKNLKMNTEASRDPKPNKMHAANSTMLHSGIDTTIYVNTSIYFYPNKLSNRNICMLVLDGEDLHSHYKLFVLYEYFYHLEK